LLFKPDVGKKLLSSVGYRGGDENAPDSRGHAFDVPAELTDSVRSDSSPFQFQNNWGAFGVMAPDIDWAGRGLIFTGLRAEAGFNAVWLLENEVTQVVF
jgi:hypothetical protein